MDLIVSQEKGSKSNSRLLEALTARLPHWFEQAAANRHYAEQAGKLEAWIARLDGQAAGMLLLMRHSATSAEIYWLGVDPSHHRRGIGRALINALERHLSEEKARFLFVKTLHPDVDYEPYQRTPSFYVRLGFEFALSAGQSSSASSPDLIAYYLKPL